MSRVTGEARALVYIHGFQSSPQSAKARQLADGLGRAHPGVRLVAPALSFDPRDCMARLEQALDALAGVGVSKPLLVGSSMGGFYATAMAERRQLRAVLVNPAVRPHELLAGHLGEELVNPHSGERHRLDGNDLDAFRALAVARPSRPQDLLVLLQTGDEILDWRQAAETYADCSVVKLLGGNHSFENFEDVFPLIYRLGGLEPAS